MKTNSTRNVSVFYFLLIFTLLLATVLTGCFKSNTRGKNEEINLFIAASLTGAVGEIVKDFESKNKGVKIIVNADSSGKLKSQIMEGFDCDIFLSASTREMEELKKKNLLIENSTINILGNQLAIIGAKDYEGSVKGLDSIKNAKSISLPYSSVPAGFYARKALVSNGFVRIEKNKNESTEKVKESIKKIDGKIVAEALGDVAISEKDNVSSALSSVAEKSTEIGFVYVSDSKRNRNVKIIEVIDSGKTGEIKYPMSKVKSNSSDKNRDKIVNKLYYTLLSDESKIVYKKYGFKVY